LQGLSKGGGFAPEITLNGWTLRQVTKKTGVKNKSSRIREASASLKNEGSVKVYSEVTMTHWDGKKCHNKRQAIIGEEPLAIRIQGKSYSVIMRTPGDEKTHAAGFCLAEGIVDSPDDIAAIGVCDDGDTNVVTITLTASRREKIKKILERRAYVSQTSCGICGKEIVKDIQQHISRLSAGPILSADHVQNCIDVLSDHQPLRRQTFASHAAAIFNENCELLASAEDVGRHNALDKAIGYLFLNRLLPDACLLVLSSRTSYELIQKAARAQIPIVVAVSRPTLLAVRLSDRLDITLACLAPDGGLYVFSGRGRLGL
jgi:FdhD protein